MAWRPSSLSKVPSKLLWVSQKPKRVQSDSKASNRPRNRCKVRCGIVARSPLLYWLGRAGQDSVSVASEARASQSQAGISRLYKRAEPSQAKLLSKPSWMSQAGQNAGYGKAPAPALARAMFESGALSHQCRPAEVCLQRYETRVH